MANVAPQEQKPTQNGKGKKVWMPPAPVKDANGLPLYDYATFPRQFVSYRWFKPLLVGVLAFIFMLVFQILLLVAATVMSGDPNYIYTIGTGYDDMDIYTAPGALVELGGVAALLPALLLAGLIVRDRPFSSYTTSRGGWNWKAFWKCVLVAFIVIVVPQIIQLALFPDDYSMDGAIKFTVAGFIFCTIITPFQCMAEEYVFRGWLLQTVSSWTRLPILAILVAGVAFAALHPYNMLGVIIIFLDGVLWGVIAWQTRGLEATGAAHIVNNMAAFYFAGFGFTGISADVDYLSFGIALITDLIYVAIILVAAKKFNWFTAKGDGVTAYNEKRLAAMARKQAARQRPVQQMPVQPMPGQPAQQMPVQPIYVNGQWVYPQPTMQQPYPAQQPVQQPYYAPQPQAPYQPQAYPQQTYPTPQTGGPVPPQAYGQPIAPQAPYQQPTYQPPAAQPYQQYPAYPPYPMQQQVTPPSVQTPQSNGEPKQAPPRESDGE